MVVIIRTTLVAAVAAAAGLGCAAPSAHAFDAATLLRQYGLTFQDSAGFLGAEGPAALIMHASAALRAGGEGNTALYTGAGGTGIGFLIVSGNGQPPTLDFQVIGMTAANVENNSDQLNAVYSDDGSELDATIPPDTDMDIPVVDVDYAVYPPGYTPPPDNHGLNPTAAFVF
jgi:hypothetical protein